MTVQLAPTPFQKFFNNNGAPLAFGLLYSYVAGTTNPQATYTDATQTTQNTNPVVLNARGEASVWLDTSLAYKLVLKDQFGNQIWSQDNIPGGVTSTITTGGYTASNVFTATAGQTVFTLSSTPSTVLSMLVTLDGAVLIPNVDYTLSGGTVTLTNGALAGQTLFCGYSITSANVFNQTFNGQPADVENVFFHRVSAYSGGTVGFVNSVMRLQTDVTGPTAAAFEWTFTSIMNNSSAGGQNVAIYGQGNRQTSSAGPTWGGVMEVREVVATNNPSWGLVGLEVDNRSNGTDANSNRLGIDVVIARYNTSGPATTATWGVRVQAGNDPNVTIRNGFAVYQANCAVAFDCAFATVASGSLRMAQNVPILFDANGYNQFLYDGTGLAYKASVNGGATFYEASRLNADGSIAFGGNGLPIQLVGTSAPTATAGASGAPPATVAGYLVGSVAGATVKIPYYSN